MRPPKTVQIIVHVHNGVPVSTCPDPCSGLRPGDTIVWTKCEAKDPHDIVIHAFKESATGRPNNPMERDEYRLTGDQPAEGRVRGGAQNNLYKYTVEVANRLAFAERANAYMRKQAIAEAQAAQSPVTAAAAEGVAVTLEPPLANVFKTEEQLLDFVREMAASLAPAALDPQIQIGGESN